MAGSCFDFQPLWMHSPSDAVATGTAPRLKRRRASRSRQAVRRQFLGDLAGDAIDDLCVKGLAQVIQYSRRRDDDELVEAIGVSMMIERFRELMSYAPNRFLT